MQTGRTCCTIRCLLVIWLFSACSSTPSECPDDYYDVGPVTQETLVTSYFSVEYQLEGRESQCRLRYQAPVNSTVYQGMIAAHQQHGDNFTYEYDTYSEFGHHVTTINGVSGHDTFHWALHHGDTWETADFGVDFLYVLDEDLYLYRYTEYNGGEFEPSNFTGDCHDAIDDITPPFQLTDVVVYLSVSTQNTDQFPSDAITVPMCKRLVLTDSESSLHDVTLAANDQLVVSFVAEIDQTTFAIESVNGLDNQGGYTWRMFDVLTGELLPADLRLSGMTDGGHYEYRFTPDVSTQSPTAQDVTVGASTTDSGCGPGLIYNSLWAIIIGTIVSCTIWHI